MEKLVDIDLDIDGNVMPQENGKIALIDADTLCYTSALLVEQQEFQLGKEFCTDEEWEAIITNKDYDKDTHSIWTIDLDKAYEKVLEKLQRIYDKTGCRECEMHFTGGKENFRYEVKKDYKANRIARTPAGLSELKKMCLDNFNGTLSTKWEADDIVVWKKEQEPDKYIMVAIDKDLLYSVEGKHFNYYESAKFNKEMKWVEVDANTKIKWPFIQAIVGDKVDNIEGIKGLGPKKAEKVFAGCTNKLECWEALVDCYEANGKTMIDALQTIRLVDMHQFNGKEIILWDPRNLVENTKN